MSRLFPKIDPLTGADDYRRWRNQIEEVLVVTGKFGWLSGEKPRPEEEEDKAMFEGAPTTVESQAEDGGATRTPKEEEEKKPTATRIGTSDARQAWDKVDRELTYWIRHYLDESLKSIIEPGMTSNEVWEILRETYEISGDAEISALDDHL
ncbi:hypothetical protein JCM5296_000530 [Sporobolomyces johnsonii]